MSIYRDPRTIKKVSIPSIPESEVEIYNTFLWGDLEKVYDAEGSDIEKGIKILSCLVKDWNLTDEKGEKLPIKVETFKQFTPEIINFLLSNTDISGQGDESKKKIES
jgi:hypothetical protein